MSTPFNEPELDVQATLLMWKEAYQRVNTKLGKLEALAKRLAFDLECVLLNHDKGCDHAHKTLQAYRDLMNHWYPQETTNDLTRCPNCGGPADNGHDREVPPNPYWCSKCMES